MILTIDSKVNIAWVLICFSGVMN